MIIFLFFSSRHRQWEATVHGPIVGHYAAERTFFCDVTPPSKDPVHGDDDAPSAEPAVLATAVAAASAAKAAAIKEARGADAERQYDDVVDNASEVSSRAQRVCAVDALSVPTPSPPPPHSCSCSCYIVCPCSCYIVCRT